MKKETIGDCTLYLGDCLEVMPGLAGGSVEMIWTDPPYGHSNHDGDLNAQLNKHRDIENKPIANDDPESFRSVMDGMLLQAARILKSDCCCCCGGGGPKPTFAWVADRMDKFGLQFFHSVIWDKKNPGLGWRYRRQHEMIMVSHRKGGGLGGVGFAGGTVQQLLIDLGPCFQRPFGPRQCPGCTSTASLYA